MHGRSINSLSLPPDDADDLTIDPSLIERTLRVLTSSPSELDYVTGQKKRSDAKYVVGMIVVILLFLACWLGLFLPTVLNHSDSSSPSLTPPPHHNRSTE